MAEMQSIDKQLDLTAGNAICSANNLQVQKGINDFNQVATNFVEATNANANNTLPQENNASLQTQSLVHSAIVNALKSKCWNMSI